jgi:hypothetical protein
MNLGLIGTLGTVLVMSCSSASPTSSTKGPAAGWQDAGLVLSAADVTAGGVAWLSTVGNRIIASTASGKVFLGQQGSMHWDSIPFPGGDSVYSQASVDSSVYFGTRSSGQVWQLTFPTKTWTSLNTGFSSPTSVNFIQPWNSQLAIFLRPIGGTIIPTILGHSGSWKSIGQNWPSNDGATIALSVDSQLFGGTFQTGLWRRSTSDTSWHMVPNAIYYEKYVNDSVNPTPMNHPRALAWYHGNLWMGNLYFGQIFHMTGTDTPWVSVSQQIVGTGIQPLPIDFAPLTMFVWKDRLFVAGSPPTPMVLKEGVGWELMSQNFGKSVDGSSSICGENYTLAFAAIGDTLYAGGCGHVLKLPASQVPQ